MRRTAVAFLALLLLASAPAHAAKAAKAPKDSKDSKSKDSAPKTHADSLLSADTFSGLELRGIGPAVTSGRISDIAIDPSDENTWYVAVSCGNVWKTSNAGTTWTPIFDDQASYSIGCVAIDPKDPLVVWLGSGENNSQRSVGYGDGVYKSVDGGKTWENVGLKDSQHVGKILIDPRDSDVAYVAAQGPLWNSGGDRGVYKTTDGGASWNRVLEIDENTGANEVVFDPRNPDVLYASAYQRARRVWTLVDGGPGSAIYKSSDAGANWKKLENGLPKEQMGRIGLAVSPADPDVVYAIVEAADKAGGFFRSRDAGGSWEKMSDENASSPQYYHEIIADPKAVGRVYSMDTWMRVTEDGGKTFSKVGEKYKHVDNHSLWIEPTNTEHLIAGCDGGVYETFDRGATWEFKANMPLTQFYKVTVDNATPFYNVYGGTQDNNTLGGPSRTLTAHGIRNSDWFVTVGGDGFQTQVDPTDPNVLYSQAQYGVLVRYDKKNGETIDIQPRAVKDEPPLRWNWDSPLILSPHQHTRLYFAANRLFRSDDRGNSWRAVSPDLTRQLDRNRLEVMGQVWSVDAVAKNASSSFYGNIVSLTESPVQEGLIYIGTDDGLVQVTEDGGAAWRKIAAFPGVPDLSYVSRVTASSHDANVVYAAFENHKMGDFKPYLLRSGDRGKSWTSIAGDLPERGSVLAVVEDHVEPKLLFAGTEFGVFFTNDGGKRWIQLKGGMPTIAVRDLAIQRRENDLVVGTFGRSFYILDDYAALRRASLDVLDREAALFSVKPALIFVPSQPLGLRDKSMQGDAYYTAPNPPFGAAFTYYLRDEIKSKKKARREAEKGAVKKGEDVFYPSWDALRAEDREEDPTILLTVTDDEGNVVRRIEGPVKKGFHRVAWDLRYPNAYPTQLKPPSDDDPFADVPVGPLAAPGRYTVALAKRVDGVVTPLALPESFTTEPLGISSLPAPDRAALLAFQKKTARLQRAALGAVEAATEAQSRIDHVKKALDDTPGADPRLRARAREIESRLKEVVTDLSGDRTLAKRNEPAPSSIVDLVQGVAIGHWSSTADATRTHREAYEMAAARFGETLAELRALVETDLAKLENDAEAVGAPWTPGRVPRWNSE